MTTRPVFRATLWVMVALGLAGCGLKGALTLPSQSDEVVIRGAGQTAPASPESGGTASEPAATPASGTSPANEGATPADPAAAPAVKKPARREDRPPPPPLPGSNPGTARGG